MQSVWLCCITAQFIHPHNSSLNRASRLKELMKLTKLRCVKYCTCGEKPWLAELWKAYLTGGVQTNGLMLHFSRTKQLELTLAMTAHTRLIVKMCMFPQGLHRDYRGNAHYPSLSIKVYSCLSHHLVMVLFQRLGVLEAGQNIEDQKQFDTVFRNGELSSHVML